MIKRWKCNQEDMVYLKHLDRGGLKWPKEFLVDIISQMYVLFKVVISSEFEIEFIKVRNQRAVLKKLSVEMLIYKDTLIIYNKCECGESYLNLIEKCSTKFCNILLNNYSKVNRDKIYRESHDSTSGNKKRNKLSSC